MNAGHVTNVQMKIRTICSLDIGDVVCGKSPKVKFITIIAAMRGMVSRSLGISLQCTAVRKSSGIPKLIYYAHTRYLDNYARTRSPHANLLKQGLGCGPDPNIPSTYDKIEFYLHSTSSPSLRHSVSATPVHSRAFPTFSNVHDET